MDPPKLNIQQTTVEMRHREINKFLSTIMAPTVIEPWISGRFICLVMIDLFKILEPLRPIKIEKFGSVAIHLAVEGKRALTKITVICSNAAIN